MKFLRIWLVVLLTAFAMQANARQSVPVVNHENIAFVASSASPTLEQVHDAIVKAAASKQWSIVDQGAGHMLATLNVHGKHVVVTQIVFDTSKFSVTYSDSVNMRYGSGPDGVPSIHPFYNRWVGDLTDAIRTSLLTRS